jgi:hypothetical protein
VTDLPLEPIREPAARPIIIVGHDIPQDLQSLSKAGFEITDVTHVVATIDTQKLAREMSRALLPDEEMFRADDPGWSVSLRKLCGLVGMVPRKLHDCGNDAAWTLLVFLCLAAKILGDDNKSDDGLDKLGEITKSGLLDTKTKKKIEKENKVKVEVEVEAEYLGLGEEPVSSSLSSSSRIKEIKSQMSLLWSCVTEVWLRSGAFSPVPSSRCLLPGSFPLGRRPSTGAPSPSARLAHKSSFLYTQASSLRNSNFFIQTSPHRTAEHWTQQSCGSLPPGVYNVCHSQSLSPMVQLAYVAVSLARAPWQPSPECRAPTGHTSRLRRLCMAGLGQTPRAAEIIEVRIPLLGYFFAAKACVRFRFRLMGIFFCFEQLCHQAERGSDVSIQQGRHAEHPAADIHLST